MKFNPPNLKFKKPHAKRIKVNALDTKKKLIYGNIGLQLIQVGRLTASHIESARLVVKRALNKNEHF